MNYDEWIERERRIRIRILNSSPMIQEKQIYRVCIDCGEVCLCHEENCPNCNSCRIENQLLLLDNDKSVASKIRCQYRFMKLIKSVQ